MDAIDQQMPFVSRAMILARSIEWRTLTLIVACHGVWLTGGLLWAAAPLLSLPLLIVMIVLHSSLQHETIHRHPTRSVGWNEALVWLPLGLVVPYRRFRDAHLRHHVDAALTDPTADPESFYLAANDWDRLPRLLKALLSWNNRLLVRVLVGPVIIGVAYYRAETRALLAPGNRDGTQQARHAWALHGAGVVAVLLIVKFVFAMPFGVYLLAAYCAQSLLLLRSFCEHRWDERIAARTVIVESALGWLFLNNNLHAVHHAHPGLPWHALPAAYRTRREEWHHSNDGYVFRGYGEVLRKFAFRAKEPVRHPAR